MEKKFKINSYFTVMIISLDKSICMGVLFQLEMWGIGKSMEKCGDRIAMAYIGLLLNAQKYGMDIWKGQLELVRRQLRIY